jgi:undecaprenyl diphosphate synthase
VQSDITTHKSFTVQSEQPAGLHVAIIMDGNGRWAARRNLARVAGHRAGVAAVRRIVEHAPKVGIGRLTVYAFSSDNWRRPAPEVQSIFWLLRAFLRLERERLRQAGVRLEVIGRRERIPKLLLREIDQAESVTAEGRRLLLRVAIDYSSRDAIMRAALGVSRQPSAGADPLGFPAPGQARSGAYCRERRGGPAHSHWRRETPFRLLIVGVCLRRTLVYRSYVAGF